MSGVPFLLFELFYVTYSDLTDIFNFEFLLHHSCQGSDCVFEEEFQGSTIVMDVRESKGELANLPGIEAGSACSVCSEGDKTLVLFGSELATPTDFCSATYGWYRVRTFISPVCPLIDTDDDEDDGGSNFSQAAERFGLIALLLFTSWFMG
jgi:hypothetical protein